MFHNPNLQLSSPSSFSSFWRDPLQVILFQLLVERCDQWFYFQQTCRCILHHLGWEGLKTEGELWFDESSLWWDNTQVKKNQYLSHTKLFWKESYYPFRHSFHICFLSVIFQPSTQLLFFPTFQPIFIQLSLLQHQFT